MCNTRVIFCLIVVIGGILASSEDGSDLNLKSIFRTPKDFSKVNFDHFELLERNNFENKNPAESSIDNVKAEETKAEDKTSKSIANAQVMLRIGGEDIHDCNRVILHRPPYSSDHPVYSEPLPLHSNDIRYPGLPHPAAFPCVPPPSYSFPGNYYNPGHIPNYIAPSYQDINSNAAPHEFTINLPETYSTQQRPGTEEHFLELPKKEDVVCIENVRPKVVVEKPNPCDNQVQEVEVINAPQEPCKNAEQQVYVTDSESSEPTVVQTSCEHTSKVCNPESMSTGELELSPTKVAYAEVNLADIGKASFDTPKDDIATLLDQALVPLSCQKCSKTNPLLVSYPVLTQEGNVATIPQEEVVSQCPTCSHDVFCESCNKERNPDIPYGHRFAKDVDSLFEIADSSPELYVPPSLYNEAPSENLIKVQPALPPLKVKSISTVVPTETECQPEKDEVQIVPPCPEEVETPCPKREVVQETTPCVESSAAESSSTKLVPVELPQVVEPPVKHQVDWSQQKSWEQPSQQTVTETVQPYTETIESPYVTQEVPQVSNSCHEPFGAQQHIFKDFYNGAPEEFNYQSALPEHYPQGDIGHALNPYSNSPYVQQSFEVNNPCHDSPYVTQNIVETESLQQEPAQAVFQAVSGPTTFTRPGSLTEVTFYPDDGSPSTTKQVIQTGNSYSGYPCPVQNVDQPITIQPVYKRFPTVSSGVSTYQDLLTKLYPQRDIIQTSNHYESPCVQEVQFGNSYYQSPYATQEYVKRNYPGTETFSVQPNYNQIPTVHSTNSYNYGHYPTQEAIETSHPCPGSFTAPPVYNKVPTIQIGSSYDHVPYPGQQVSETSGSNTYPGSVTIQSVYNKVPSFHITNSQHQTPYTTQEVVQKRYPCYNSIKPDYKKYPDIDVRGSYNQPPSRTQVIQTRKSCPERITLQPGRNPIICLRNSYSQSPCTTQQVGSTNQPRTETYTIPNAYSNAHTTQVYHQAASGAQQAYQSSESHHESSVTTPTAYSHVPSFQVSNPYSEVSYGTQQGSQVSYPCSQHDSQSAYYKVPQAASYQTEYPKGSHYASYTASPYAAHQGVQAGSTSYTACPYTGHQASSSYPQSASAYTTPEVNVEKPQVYYSGASANSHTQYSVDYSKYGSEQPKVYLDGYKATCGSSYYSNPYKSIHYKQPTVVDGYKSIYPLSSQQYANLLESYKPTTQAYHYSTPAYSTGVQHTAAAHPFLSLYGDYKASSYPVTSAYQHPAYTNCVHQQPKLSQPHLYKIVGRYDHVPKDDIKALNIPDLVPTNQYLKVDRPAYHGQHVPVDNVPLVKNEPYAQGYGYGWPYWKNVPVQREVPLAPSYYPVCSQCAKYRGELNQINCDR